MNLSAFNQSDFLSALKSFFKDLKVPVNYLADEPDSAKNILSSTYRDNEAFQLMDDVYILGMIDDAAFAGNKSPDVSNIHSDYDGILIFGVTLKKRSNGLLPTRGQLAEMSRAFNREFHYTPVVVIFKYDGQIAFANTERLKYKQGWREGEKSGKVSVLRDVNIQSPHRGHLEILKELEIPTSGKNTVDSFSTLYKYWQEVFSVSILNKKFYNELQNWYFWAIKEVTFPNTPNRFDFETNEKFDEAIKEHKGKNVIRLLTRILFIWFIKEKKLIPEQLFDEKFIANKLIKDFTPQKPQGIFATGKQNSPYYRAILQNLFFATLNQEMGKRAFRGDGQHQNVTNLMRYKSYFKAPDYFIQLMEEVVPFMNGGLFECLDKPHPTIKGKQGGDIIIYNDGFSDRDDNLLVVPDYLFFDVEEDVDLSDDFGNKVYKNAKTRGLLEILQSYKFTITENTPIEEDVALDPELLGKVFENLLASYNPETKTTARKQTGSFYTPREIVNYMVDESLVAYLKSTVSFQLTAVPEASSVSEASSFGIDQSKDALGTVGTFFDPDSEIDIHNGNLPHWHQKDVWYFVTFRLSDSIPLDKVEELKKDREIWKLKHKGKTKNEFTKDDWKEYHRLFSERVEGWMNASYGACVLRDAENAKIVANAIKYFQGSRYELDEWVVMPNHVHILVKPLNEHTLPQICHSWKSFTANEINKRTGNNGQLWMHESYDHIVRNGQALAAIRNYIRQNPAKAGIVSEASSFGISVSTASSFGIIQSKDALGTATVDQSKDALDTMLHQLLSYDTINPFQDNPAIQKQLIKALDQCTILDPACGSGAFPMGILQKMVHVLHKIDPKNTEWEQRQIDRVNKAIESLEEIDDVRFREQSIKELKTQIKDIEDSFENNELDYGRKLYLIENCIYGVDIQSIATQISKLRFFISLIVDQKIDKTKENFGIRPLPNLETKFVAANTLIGINKPKVGDFTGSLYDNQEIKKLEAELKKVRHKLFSAKVPATKRKLREQDKELRNRIADLLINDGWENQTARQLASWDPYDQNESSPFFDLEWMFDIKEGFDVVIGNPPYGAKFTDEEKTLFKKIFKHQDYQPESFLFFTEKSFELLKYGAVLSFIIPNTWLTNLKLIKIRKFLTADNAILNISHYHKSVFDAVVDTEVVIFRKGYVAQNQVNVFIHETTDSILKIAHNQDKWKEHNGEVINIFSNKKIEKVIDSIKNNTYKISEFCNVVVGMKPYQVGKGKPKQDRHCVENRIFDSELKVDDSYRRLLRGRDIEKYKINWDGKRWIKFGDWLAEPRYSANFEAIEKIVLRQTGDSLIASLDTTQFICMNNLHVLTNKSDSLSLSYILALLNSSLLNFYFQYLNPEIGEALAEVKKETVEKLLIKETSNQKPFINLVNQILSTKKGNPKANTIKLERQLDEMVFKLYELTYEEVKVVAPDFWLSEAEYEAVEIE